jgi:hypothetical protein
MLKRKESVAAGAIREVVAVSVALTVEDEGNFIWKKSWIVEDGINRGGRRGERKEATTLGKGGRGEETCSILNLALVLELISMLVLSKLNPNSLLPLPSLLLSKST